MANSKKGTAQVNPPTPKQRVNAKFGSKSALVDDLISLMGGNGGDLRGKLMQVSNTRLVSHHRATKRMVESFGSKSGVIEAITAIRFAKGKPDEGFQAKLESYSPWRLMDLYRQTQDWERNQAKLHKAEERARAIKAKRRAKVRARRS